MMNLFDVRKFLGATAISSIAIAIGLSSVEPSYGAKGGNCRPGSTCPAGIGKKMCISAMNEKGLKGAERKAEFEKCQNDPAGYK